jgi:hypothetical protein
LLIFGLCYVLTVSAAVGSFEGIIYTHIPLKFHLIGLPEIVLYNTIFTIMLWLWYKKPQKLYNIISAILVAIIVLMSLLGILVSIGMIKV